MTAICVPIFVQSGVDYRQAIADAEDALRGMEGLIELRCDTATPQQMLEAIRAAKLPVIVTVRSASEGGRSRFSNAERLALWQKAIDAGAKYIDVELATWEKDAAVRDGIGGAIKVRGTQLIFSNHHFDGRPADLHEGLKRLQAVKSAGILKLAWKAESLHDALDALTMTRANREADGRPLLALAMGEEGVISRLLAKKFGSPLTFASVSSGKESAPGQPAVAALRTRYRWDRQAADTPVYGVIGWPVGHSLSPHLHNAGFDAVGARGVYVPLAIHPDYDSFAAVVDRLCKELDLRGVSVTIPHKENAIRFIRARGGNIDELSERIGAINTIVWRAPGGPPEGFNTDYAGAMEALASAWGGQRDAIAGKRIVVFGAGGAGRAIIAGLAAHGAEVVIYSLPHPQAEAVAAEFNGQTGKVIAVPWELRRDARADAFINTTPIGMHPNIDASPIDFDPQWSKDTVVFDIVYNPLTTRFLKQAQAKGAKIIPGIEMFIRQAAIQFKSFTGHDAPLDLFRKILLSALTSH